MNLGDCYGNYNNTGVQNNLKFMLFWVLGTCALGMNWVDFYWCE